MPTNTAPAKAGVNCEPLKKLIREVPDFPKKGILFYDITTLLKDKVGFARLIDALSGNYIGQTLMVVSRRTDRASVLRNGNSKRWLARCAQADFPASNVSDSSGPTTAFAVTGCDAAPLLFAEAAANDGLLPTVC